MIDEDALKVLYRLHKAGYRAFLVGGSVRDLMLGRRPKDFDVGTSAKPPEIRRLFRNARIIGRRFRLAHILFRDNIVEVSTFRREPDPKQQASAPEDLLITSDNTFGTPAEDAFRRDFTINGLFYDISDFSVVDYVGGIDDLERRLVRVIGDPDVRFQEDPVRILRACEFAGRLGFTIETGTQLAIERNVESLKKGAPPRLAEEILQLLRCGAAGASLQWMLELGVLEVVVPEASAMLRAKRVGAGDFSAVLPVIDQLVAERRTLSDPLLLAALLLPAVLLERFAYERDQRRSMPLTVYQEVRAAAAAPFFERLCFANHKRTSASHIMDGFHRICTTRWTPSKQRRFAATRIFPDALLLLEILVRATGHGRETLEGWQALASAPPPADSKARPALRRRTLRGGRRRPRG